MKTLKYILAAIAIGLLVFGCDTKQEVEKVEEPATEQENPAQENGKGKGEEPSSEEPGSGQEAPEQGSNQESEPATPENGGETPSQGSSDNTSNVGDWPPIDVDKSSVPVSFEGGEVTFLIKNYSHWWICDGYEWAKKVGDKIEYTNLVHASSSSDEVTYDILDGGWYHAYVPDKGKSDKLIVKVDPNDTDKTRYAFIDMTVGDAFTTVKIIQSSKQGDDNNEVEGDWPAIQLDKDELHFSTEGGTDTITSLNYPGWWICHGYDDAWNVDGKIEYKNFVSANNNTGGQYFSYMDCGWYFAYITNELKNQLVITVKNNTTGEPRKATIEMESGDAFTIVKIFQE